MYGLGTFGAFLREVLKDFLGGFGTTADWHGVVHQNQPVAVPRSFVPILDLFLSFEPSLCNIGYNTKLV